jgi:sugar phosphate isomerase/epimerase
MKYGAVNSPLRRVLNELREIADLGFDYLELTMDAPEATPKKILGQKRGILDLLSSSNLELISHLPTFVSTANLYESIRNASRKEILEALEASFELGVKKAVIHPSYVTGLGKYVKDRVKKLGYEFLEEAYVRAENLEITLCLENMTPMEGWLFEPEEFKEVFERFENIKLTLDLGHANIQTKESTVHEFIKFHGKKIAHLHANDNFGKEDNHLPLGCGKIKFDEIFSEIKKMGYDDTLTLEVFSQDRDYLKLSLQKAKMIWKKS